MSEKQVAIGKCSHVGGDSAWRPACGEDATVVHNGTNYCDKHDPDQIRKQEMDRLLKRMDADKRTAACVAACGDVATEKLLPGMVVSLLAYIEKLEARKEQEDAEATEEED